MLEPENRSAHIGLAALCVKPAALKRQLPSVIPAQGTSDCNTPAFAKSPKAQPNRATDHEIAIRRHGPADPRLITCARITLRPIAAQNLDSRTRTAKARSDRSGGHPSETVGGPGLPVLNFQPRRGKEISGVSLARRASFPRLRGYSFPFDGLVRAPCGARATQPVVCPKRAAKTKE